MGAQPPILTKCYPLKAPPTDTLILLLLPLIQYRVRTHPQRDTLSEKTRIKVTRVNPRSPVAVIGPGSDADALVMYSREAILRIAVLIVGGTEQLIG